MSKHRRIGIQFPLAGLNRKAAYRQQPPFSCYDSLNVRAVGTADGRERGGSRPGLVTSHLDNLGSEIRMLAPMTLAFGDSFTAWSDTFSGTSMSNVWTAAEWLDTPALPNIMQGALASVDTTLAEAGAVLDALTIDTSEIYTVECFLLPWGGEYHGNYRLYFRLDDTTPDITADGVLVEISMTGATDSYVASLKSYASGVETEVDTASVTLSGLAVSSWLSAVIDGDIVTVYWNGEAILTGTVDTHTGTRVGFGMECTEDGGVCLTNAFRVQYYSTGNVPTLRTTLVASAGGNLYTQTTYGRMEIVTSGLTVRDDTTLLAVQSGQKLYIADYGDLVATDTDGVIDVDDETFSSSITDWDVLITNEDDLVAVLTNVTGNTVAGTYKITAVTATTLTLSPAPGDGTCAFRVERAPKVYDPLTDSISLLTANVGYGEVPTGCPLIWRSNDRIYLAGAEIAPHVWYCDRRGSSGTDWDYSQEDEERAMYGINSPAGVPGEPLTAGFAHSDDYSIMACLNSIWRLNGDPASGGTLSALSHTIGIIGPKAWCFVPDGSIVFLSLDGLYALPPGGNAYPIALSRDVLPKEFLNINPSTVNAQLEYDISGRGIHIFLTPTNSNARLHWWMDWDRKTFWPVSMEADYEPTCTCVVQSTTIEDSGVILGCRDGTLRKFSDLAETDCGTAYETYVLIGPIALAPDSQVGIIITMDAEIAAGSGDVTWEIKPALTFESSINANYSDTGTWIAGLNMSIHPACRGQAFTMKLTGESGRKWEIENITAVIRDAGRRRIP